MIAQQKKIFTTREVADRYYELAMQGKWFEIQDEFFTEDVRSIDPPGSPYMGYAEGKASVRKKGEDFVSRIEAVHSDHFTEPVVSGNHFAVARELELTVRPHGRIRMDEIMLYTVKDGRIVSEQFFY